MKALGSNGCWKFYQQTTVSFWKRKMIGELALTTQWCSGHRMKVRLADLIQPTEVVTGKPTSNKRAGHHYRVFSTYGPTVFTFFLIMGDNDIF